MEANQIFIKNNASSRKKSQYLKQRTTSNSRNLNKIEIILIRHSRKVQSLDGLQESSQVFQRTTQNQWMTNKMVSQIAGL